MGEFFVEGLGTLLIEGNVPNEAEQKAIANQIGDPDDEGDPFISSENIEPGVEPAAPVDDRPLSERMAEADRDSPPTVPEGPLGIMPIEARQDVRETMERQSGLIQLVAEMLPSVAGTLAGAGVGGLVGTAGGPLAPITVPAGMIIGGMVGGFSGEIIGQETGIAPRSDLNLALAGGAPIVGPVVGKSLQLLRRAAGTSFVKGLSPMRVARAQNLMGGAVTEFESLGSVIIAQQTGMLSRTSGDLFGALARVKIRIQPRQMTRSRQGIDDIINELGPLSEFTDVKQAIASLQRIKGLLGDPSGVLLDTFVSARSHIGRIIKRAQAGGGEKLSSAKRVFAAMSDDLDDIANSTFRRGSQARVAKAANSRFKLEASVAEFEEAVAKFTSQNKKGDFEINFKGLQKWLDDVTNPKLRKTFNKNFDAALKDVLPDIKARLAAIIKVTSAGSPGGPASLVIRGQSAKSGRFLMGAAFGFLGSGASAAAAAVGGIGFAQAPEIMVAILTTKLGAAFLESAAQAGRGQIAMRSWQVAAEIALRSVLGEDDDFLDQKQQELEQQGRVPLSAREAVRRIEAKEKRESRPPRARGARRPSTP